MVNSVSTAGASERGPRLCQQGLSRPWAAPVFAALIGARQLWGVSEEIRTGTEARKGGWKLPNSLKDGTVFGNKSLPLGFHGARKLPQATLFG